MNESDQSSDGTESWESEEEFIQWLDDFCDYVVARYENSTAKYPDGSNIHKAQKSRGIQNDLKSGTISFQEAVERYNREVVTGSEQSNE